MSGWTWYVPSSDFQPKPTILCWSRHTLCNSYICVKYLSTIKGSSRGRHFSSSCWSPARLIRGSGSVLGSGRVFPRHNWKQAGPPPICQYLAAALEGAATKERAITKTLGNAFGPVSQSLSMMIICFGNLDLFRPVLRSLVFTYLAPARYLLLWPTFIFVLPTWLLKTWGTWSANYERWKPVK